MYKLFKYLIHLIQFFFFLSLSLSLSLSHTRTHTNTNIINNSHFPFACISISFYVFLCLTSYILFVYLRLSLWSNHSLIPTTNEVASSGHLHQT